MGIDTAERTDDRGLQAIAIVIPRLAHDLNVVGHRSQSITGHQHRLGVRPRQALIERRACLVEQPQVKIAIGVGKRQIRPERAAASGLETEVILIAGADHAQERLIDGQHGRLDQSVILLAGILLAYKALQVDLEGILVFCAVDPLHPEVVKLILERLERHGLIVIAGLSRSHEMTLLGDHEHIEISLRVEEAQLSADGAAGGNGHHIEVIIVGTDHPREWAGIAADQQRRRCFGTIVVLVVIVGGTQRRLTGRGHLEGICARAAVSAGDLEIVATRPLGLEEEPGARPDVGTDGQRHALSIEHANIHRVPDPRRPQTSLQLAARAGLDNVEIGIAIADDAFDATVGQRRGRAETRVGLEWVILRTPQRLAAASSHCGPIRNRLGAGGRELHEVAPLSPRDVGQGCHRADLIGRLQRRAGRVDQRDLQPGELPHRLADMLHHGCDGAASIR